MEFVHIPAGPFVYGPEECYERLEHCRSLRDRQIVELEAFSIAKFPVINRDWQAFIEGSGYSWAGEWYRVVKGWRGRLVRAYAPTGSYPTGHDLYPIVDVTQHDAYAYCEWLSSRIGQPCTLPTEEQWETTARGTDGRIYPWGDIVPPPEIQRQKAFPVGLDTYVFSLMVKPRRPWACAGWYWRNGHPLPVGTIPQNVSSYGCVDMSGNIWEWTRSLYNPELPGYHAVKGGSWGLFDPPCEMQCPKCL